MNGVGFDEPDAVLVLTNQHPEHKAVGCVLAPLSPALGTAGSLLAGLIGLGLALFFPERLRIVSMTIAREPIEAAVSGILATLGFAAVAVLLCLSILGIPVALLLAAGAPFVLTEPHLRRLLDGLLIMDGPRT